MFSRRYLWEWVVGCLATALMHGGSALAASPAVGSEAGVPLPPGISALREPTKVELGATTLQVYSFMTPLDAEALIKFYQETLPDAGWHIEQLPWQAQQAKVTERLEKTLKEHRGSPEEPQLKSRLTEFQQAQQTMQRQLYAWRGTEHVIVNLWPMSEGGGTAVFINRWQGDRSWLEGPHTAEGSTAQAGQGWPHTNVCCSGEAVPGVNSLPLSIPWYPKARAVARSTAPGSGGATVLLMTSDGTEAVAAFYRTQMPSTGWKLLNEETVGKSEGSGPGRLLTFQKPDRTCVITIQEGGASEDGTRAQTLITVAASVRASDARGPAR